LQVSGEVSNEVARLFRGSRSGQSAIPPSHGSPSDSSSTSIVAPPRFRLARNFGRQQHGKKKRDHIITGPFMKDIILLGGPQDDKVPRQGTRVWLMESQHILSGAQLRKEWDSDTVISFIKGLFPSKLKDSDHIEILMSVHFKLIAPTLAPGQSLPGFVLQKIFKDKPVYVRPSRQILDMCASNEEPDLEPSAKREKLDDEQFEVNQNYS
jgi:hypothetical protein